MTRKECLDKAAECVCGQREQDYGKPENNFQAIADLWNAYYRHKRLSVEDAANDIFFSAFDVAMMMALLKVGRIATGTATDDSFVDACGYLACGAEIKGENRAIVWDHIKKAICNNASATESYVTVTAADHDEHLKQAIDDLYKTTHKKED